MKPLDHIHILGVAGHAMWGVAVALKKRGYEVTGTDEGAYPPVTEWLDDYGIKWWKKPSIDHLDGVNKLVLGGGVSVDHPELAEAIRRGIEILSYPQIVSGLVKHSKRIVVAGTHGKTTTTSLITWILESAGLKPDYLIGIKPNNFATSVRLEGARVAVIEGDEYRSSSLDDTSKFKYYRPDVVIITSIEHDHPDMFPDLESVKARFLDLVKELPHEGRLYVCANSPEVVDVAGGSGAPISTYGDGSEWRAEDIKYSDEGLVYKIVRHSQVLGEVQVPLFGAHNVLNSLVAAAVCINENVTMDQLATAFKSFKGASRRFERLTGPDARIAVIDDYAHHPTEVIATITAAKQHFSGRLIVVFRPHTYSRTQALLREYQKAFTQADRAFIVPIESARESGAEANVSGEDIAGGAGSNVVYEPDRDRLIQSIVDVAEAGDVVLCMSVSGYNGLAQELAHRLV